MRTQRKPVRALDKLDRRILDLLQKDGRLSMKELSEAVGLTITPCIERVKRLEREHFIDLFNGPNQREGVNAFLEKRKAVWK